MFPEPHFFYVGIFNPTLGWNGDSVPDDHGCSVFLLSWADSDLHYQFIQDFLGEIYGLLTFRNTLWTVDA